MSISSELEKKIHDTINSLIEQSKKPTYEAIRQAGGYSFNSIKPALRSWNEQRQAKGEEVEQKNNDIEVDEELKALVLDDFEETLNDLLITVTKQAREKANEKLKLERSSHDETVNNLQSEIKDLENYIAQSDEENEKLKNDNEELDKSNADLVTNVEYLSGENKGLKRDIEKFDTDNKQLAENNKQLTIDLTKSNAQNETLLEQNSTLKLELEKTQKQLSELQDKSNQQLSEIAQLQGTVKSYENNDKEQRLELDKIRARHDEYVTQIATLKEQNKQLTSDVKDFKLEQQTEDDLAESEKKKTTATRKTPTRTSTANK